MKDREFLVEIRTQLLKWADESSTYGWSTHQVEPMRKLSNEISRYLNREKEKCLSQEVNHKELKDMVETAIYKGNDIDAVLKILEIIKRDEETVREAIRETHNFLNGRIVNYTNKQKELNQNILRRIRGLETKTSQIDIGIKMWIDAHQDTTKSQTEVITEIKNLIISMIEKR